MSGKQAVTSKDAPPVLFLRCFRVGREFYCQQYVSGHKTGKFPFAWRFVRDPDVV
jgi:hypothetical protein